MIKNLKYTAILGTLFVFLYSCGMGADARQFPPDAESRVKKTLRKVEVFEFLMMTKKEALEILILQVQIVYGEHHLIQ